MQHCKIIIPIIFVSAMVMTSLIIAQVLSSFQSEADRKFNETNYNIIDTAYDESVRLDIATAKCASDCELKVHSERVSAIDEKCENGILFPIDKNGKMILRYHNIDFSLQLNDERANSVKKEHYGNAYCGREETIKKFLKAFKFEMDENTQEYVSFLDFFFQLLDRCIDTVIWAMNSDIFILISAIVSGFIFVFYVLKREKYVTRAYLAARYRALLNDIPKEIEIIDV